MATRLAEAEAPLQGAKEERQALGTAVGLAAQQLQVHAQPEAPLVERLGTVFTAGHEWIKRGVHVGVRSSFAVLATHYRDIDFPLVSTGFVPGYTAEELAEIRTNTEAPADDLAAQFEEEALPDEGEN